MYISRVEVDIFNRGKTKDLMHLGAYHSWVEDSFPDEKENKIRSRKLWRLDVLGKKMYLILVSENKPDLALLEKYGVEGSAQTKAYDSFLSNIKNGDSMRFRVTLNPVISEAQGSGKRGKIKPCYDEKSQIKFLLDRSNLNGFSVDIDSLLLKEKGTSILKKRGFRQINLLKIVFEGILTVEDADVFRKLLVTGLGRHKAYGFGLMTVIPIKN